MRHIQQPCSQTISHRFESDNSHHQHREFSPVGRAIVIKCLVYGLMTQWQRVCFASRRLRVRVPLGPLCRRRELAYHPDSKSGVCGFKSHRRYYTAVMELAYVAVLKTAVFGIGSSNLLSGTCLVGPVAKSFPFQGKDRGFEPRTRYFKRLPRYYICTITSVQQKAELLRILWPPGGMADTADSKSAACACGFKSHGGYYNKTYKSAYSNLTRNILKICVFDGA